MQLITDIDAIKVYYPFLRDRNTRVKEHFRDILSYLLLCDKVIIPPSHFFNENVVLKNSEFLKSNDLLNQLFKNGLIITSSIDKSIRDYKDIIEKHSGLTNINIPNFSLPLYFRDVQKQKDIYVSFYKKEYRRLHEEFRDKDEYKRILYVLENKPGHTQLINELHKLSCCENKNLVDATKYLAQIAYLRSGAKGNNAIMPSLYATDEYTFFDDYYSLRFVKQFAFRFCKIIKKDIIDLSFDEFIKATSLLKSFKDDYFYRSRFMKNLDNEVYSVLVSINGQDRYRKYKKEINFIAGLVVGEMIEDIILPLFNLNSPNDFIFKIAVAFFFERFCLFDKLFSIANTTVNTATFTNYLTNYFGELIDTFDNGVKLTKL